MNTHQITAVKVGLACFLGALIGAEVALQVHVPFWLGSLVGIAVAFPVGYLSYEYRKVFEAIASAYRTTINWRPDVAAVKRRSLNIIALLTTALSPFFALLVLFIYQDPLNSNRGLLNSAVGLSEMIILSFCFLLAVAGAFMILLVVSLIRDRIIFEDVAWAKDSIVRLNPIAVFVYWPIVGFIALVKLFIEATPLAIIQCRQAIPKWSASIKKAFVAFGKALVAFSRQVFVLIHSEIRLLCGVDAALGATIGIWFGNGLLGGLYGCLFGIINYLVVSVWWLKLVPQKT